MKNIILWLLKQLGTKRAIELILAWLKDYVKTTPNETDNQIVYWLEQIYLLVYPYVPEKRRKG